MNAHFDDFPSSSVAPFRGQDIQVAINRADWGYESNATSTFFHNNHKFHPTDYQHSIRSYISDDSVVSINAAIKALQETQSYTRRVIEVGFLEGMQLLKTLQMADSHFINSVHAVHPQFINSIPMVSTSIPQQIFPFPVQVQPFQPGNFQQANFQPPFNHSVQPIQQMVVQPQVLQGPQPFQVKTITHQELPVQLQEMQHQVMPIPKQHRQHNNAGHNGQPNSNLKDMYAPVCLDYVKGICSQKRANCKFAHPPQMSLVSNLVNSNPVGEGKTVCALWMLTGTCKFGDRCRDMHVPLSDQSEGNRPAEYTNVQTVPPIPHAPITA